ncbi:MAG: hypothetical protein QXM56_04895, partial [Acidilobaceae archaeon]
MIRDLLLKIFKKSDDVLARDQFLEKPQDDLTVPETPEIKGYENHEVVDRYTVSKPYAHVFILEDRDNRERLYYVYESPLNEYEVKVFEKLKRILEWELKPFDRSLATKSSLKMSELEAEKEYLLDQVRSLLKRYSIRLEAALRKRIDWNKIYYYLVRDSIGYGPLDVIMKDPYIEDVSCNGVGKPVYVWHQKYESMPTNIVFET